MITITESSWIFAMEDDELQKNSLNLVFSGGNLAYSHQNSQWRNLCYNNE
jgi:hypothetical protein